MSNEYFNTLSDFDAVVIVSPAKNVVSTNINSSANHSDFFIHILLPPDALLKRHFCRKLHYLARFRMSKLKVTGVEKQPLAFFTPAV